MAVILGRKIGSESLAGVDPSVPPAEWENLAYKVDAGVWDWNWTAPRTGWYRFHIVGDGGSGGKGGDGWTEDASDADSEWSTGGGGGGGGHGAYCVHDKFMRKNETARFVKSSSAITASIGEDTITAGHGGNGGAGSVSSRNAGGTAGKGGAASGANSANLNGGNGGAGTQGRSGHGHYGDNNSSWTSDSYDGGVGGGLSPAMKYSNGASNASCVTPPNFNLGNGGSGGYSGHVTTQGWGDPDWMSSSSGGAGHAGGVGGVVIDAGA